MLNQSDIDRVLGPKEDQELNLAKRVANIKLKPLNVLTILERKGNDLVTYSAPWFNTSGPEAYYLQQNSQFCYKGVELPRGKCRRMFDKKQSQVIIAKNFYSLF